MRTLRIILHIWNWPAYYITLGSICKLISTADTCEFIYIGPIGKIPLRPITTGSMKANMCTKVLMGKLVPEKTRSNNKVQKSSNSSPVQPNTNFGHPPHTTGGTPLAAPPPGGTPDQYHILRGPIIIIFLSPPSNNFYYPSQGGFTNSGGGRAPPVVCGGCLKFVLGCTGLEFEDFWTPDDY